METISREEAKARGLKWYFTGVPCKRGHVAERQVANKGCRACQRRLPEVPEVLAEVARRQAEELEALRVKYGDAKALGEAAAVPTMAACQRDRRRKAASCGSPKLSGSVGNGGVSGKGAKLDPPSACRCYFTP